MRGICWVLVGALAMGIAGALLHQRVASALLEANFVAAGERNRELRRIAVEHNRLVALTANDDLAALRRTHALLVERNASVGRRPSAVAARPSVIGDGAGMRPVASLTNLGRGTPEAATETVMRAATNGDIDALAAAVAFDDATRAKASALWQSLSDASRAKYESPEKLLALFLAVPSADINSIQILAQVPAGPGLTQVRLRVKTESGQQKDSELMLQQGADGWKVLVPAKMVDSVGRMLLRPLPPLQRGAGG